MTLEYFTGYNAFLLFIPILIWNGLLFHKLPQSIKSDPKEMPRYLFRGETILRVAVFGFPFLIPLNYNSDFFYRGLTLYTIGLVIYYSSWLPLMIKPESNLTKKLIIWTAPAWTPSIFLAGITILSESLVYGIFSSMFIGAHLYHEVVRYKIIFNKEKNQ